MMERELRISLYLKVKCSVKEKNFQPLPYCIKNILFFMNFHFVYHVNMKPLRAVMILRDGHT